MSGNRTSNQLTLFAEDSLARTSAWQAIVRAFLGRVADAHETLRSQSHGAIPMVAFTQNQVGDVLTGDVCPAMGTNSNASGRNTPKVNQGMAVRRLTPTECERLQGFPDGWTAYDDQGKPISDSARYRMLGNAVAVPVAAWIGKRIVAALAGKRE